MREHERQYHPEEIEDNPQTGRQSVLNYKKNKEKRGQEAVKTDEDNLLIGISG